VADETELLNYALAGRVCRHTGLSLVDIAEPTRAPTALGAVVMEIQERRMGMAPLPRWEAYGPTGRSDRVIEALPMGVLASREVPLSPDPVVTEGGDFVEEPSEGWDEDSLQDSAPLDYREYGFITAGEVYLLDYTVLEYQRSLPCGLQPSPFTFGVDLAAPRDMSGTIVGAGARISGAEALRINDALSSPVWQGGLSMPPLPPAQPGADIRQAVRAELLQFMPQYVQQITAAVQEMMSNAQSVRNLDRNPRDSVRADAIAPGGIIGPVTRGLVERAVPVRADPAGGDIRSPAPDGAQYTGGFIS